MTLSFESTRARHSYLCHPEARALCGPKDLYHCNTLAAEQLLALKGSELALATNYELWLCLRILLGTHEVQ
jgi:hypothetical protein